MLGENKTLEEKLHIIESKSHDKASIQIENQKTKALLKRNP